MKSMRKVQKSQWPDLEWLPDGRARSVDLLNQSIAKSGELIGACDPHV